VNDAARVGGGQRTRELERQVDNFSLRQRAARQPFTQRLAFNEFAHDERAAVDITEVMYNEDVRVVERRHRTRFLVKPPQAIYVGYDVDREQFQSDRAIEPRVVCGTLRPFRLRLASR
jgi:hypothetical protein